MAACAGHHPDGDISFAIHGWPPGWFSPSGWPSADARFASSSGLAIRRRRDLPGHPGWPSKEAKISPASCSDLAGEIKSRHPPALQMTAPLHVARCTCKHASCVCDVTCAAVCSCRASAYSHTALPQHASMDYPAPSPWRLSLAVDSEITQLQDCTTCTPCTTHYQAGRGPRGSAAGVFGIQYPCPGLGRCTCATAGTGGLQHTSNHQIRIG